MRVLALDTSSRSGSVAIVEDGRVLIERAGDASRAHAERMPGDLVDALEAAGLDSADIDLFAVASGPGSFTGLRIGIATIQGFAFVHSRQVAAISALLAHADVAATGLPTGARVAAWMDAHRRDVFSALYAVASYDRSGMAVLIELEAASVEPPATVLERWIAQGTMPQAIVGDGVTLFAELLPSSVRVSTALPLASRIARLAIVADAAGCSVAPARVQPLYVRRPDAEVLRDAARLA